MPREEDSVEGDHRLRQQSHGYRDDGRSQTVCPCEFQCLDAETAHEYQVSGHWLSYDEAASPEMAAAQLL